MTFRLSTFAIYNLLGDPALRIGGNISGQTDDETFSQWRWQRFVPEDLADENVSGSSALFDYAIGEKPTLYRSGNGLEYIYQKRAGDAGLIYSVETTTNLLAGPWIQSTTDGTNLTGGLYDQITNTVPMDRDQSCIRLRIQGQVEVIG